MSGKSPFSASYDRAPQHVRHPSFSFPPNRMPQMYATVCVSVNGNHTAVGIKPDASDPMSISLYSSLVRPSNRVPQTDGAVCIPFAGKHSAIRTESQAAHTTFVPFKRSSVHTRNYIPQSNGIVVAATCQHRPVRAKHHTIHSTLMSNECAFVVPGKGVP